MSLILSKKEIENLTGLVRANAQCRWLKAEGFTVVKRRDGSPVVARRNFEKVMNPEAKPKNQTEPNWELLN